LTKCQVNTEINFDKDGIINQTKNIMKLNKIKNMKQTVTVNADKFINGFDEYDDEDGGYVFRKTYTGTIQEIITEVNKKYNITKMTHTDIDSDYACYRGNANGINYSIDID